MSDAGRRLTRWEHVSLLMVFALVAREGLSDGNVKDAGCLCPSSVARMSYCELESLYRTLPAVELAGGCYRGTVLVRKEGLRQAAAGATRIVWQGKYICPAQGCMINRVLGKPAVPAKLLMGESWLDGGSSQVFDYACSRARFARKARDEVREIRPGLYLGIMFVREECDCPRLANFFLLERECCP